MAETSSSSRVCITRLVLIPGLITLGVTILRLVGELQHWSKTLFNWAPGGGGGVIGIVWLAPIFGIYFALKLVGAGEGPASTGKAIGMAVIGLVVFAGGGFLAATSQFRFGKFLGGLAVMAVAAGLQFVSWPSLAKTLLAYGYFARIPVAIVMFFAIRGNWGTHYDGLPPNFPETAFWPKYIEVGLLPQFVLWVAFTVIVGSIFGTITAAIARRRKPVAQAA